MTVIIGAVTNIILDPIFIFGFNMGVQGAAVATVLSQALSAVWALKFLCGKNTILRIKKKNLKIKASVFLPCAALGIAPFAMQATESVLVLCFNSSLLKYGGDLAVGAMTILSSIMQFAMLPLQGITQGGQPIISYNYGAEKNRPNQAGIQTADHLVCCLCHNHLAHCRVCAVDICIYIHKRSAVGRIVTMGASHLSGMYLPYGRSGFLPANIYSIRKF